jgi:hypothetical protein
MLAPPSPGSSPLTTLQVRAALFGPVAGALGECMAMRHTIVCSAAAAAAPDTARSTAAGGTAAAAFAPWPAGDPVATFGCGELWREAAQGFSAVVKAGLPAVNIVFVNQHQAPQEDTWPVLAAAFEMFLLARGLPPHLRPPPVAFEPAKQRRRRRRPPQVAGGNSEAAVGAAGQGAAAAQGEGLAGPPGVKAQARQQLQNPATVGGDAVAGDAGGEARRPQAGDSGSGSKGAKRAGRASEAAQPAPTPDLRGIVLDTLVDNVLSACGSAPHEMWRRLVGAVAAGAAGGAPACEEDGEGSSSAASACGEGPQAPLFEHMCLRRLAELASRGSGARGADACLLEVAQLALPPLLERCEGALSTVVAGPPWRRPHGFAAAAQLEGGGEPSAAEGAAAVAHKAVAVNGAAAAAAVEEGQEEAEWESVVEDALVALDVLLGVRLENAVVEVLLVSRPHLAFWIAPSPPAPGGPGGGGGWQGHGTAGGHGHGSGSFLAGGPGATFLHGSGGSGAGGAGGGAAGRFLQPTVPSDKSAAGSADGSGSGGIPRTSSSSTAGCVGERGRAHLLAVYGPLARAMGCGEPEIIAKAQAALLAVGEELGLVPVAALQAAAATGPGGGTPSSTPPASLFGSPARGRVT